MAGAIVLVVFWKLYSVIFACFFNPGKVIGSGMS
jgi:hypothetical protein